MADIMHLLKIDAPREKVYAALTTAEGIRNWWTRDADLSESVGEFRFGSYGAGHTTKVKVDELKPVERVRWTTTASFRKEWEGTTITFELREEEGKTVLFFAHRAFAKADDCYALFTTGWGYYLVSLQQFLERGKGAPSPDADWARMIS